MSNRREPAIPILNSVAYSVFFYFIGPVIAASALFTGVYKIGLNYDTTITATVNIFTVVYLVLWYFIYKAGTRGHYGSGTVEAIMGLWSGVIAWVVLPLWFFCLALITDLYFWPALWALGISVGLLILTAIYVFVLLPRLK